MINIMFLTCSMNFGGTETHLFQLISNLDRSKFKPVVCCLYDLGSLGKILVKSQDTRVYPNVLKGKADFLGALRLFHIFKEETIDILYIINSPVTIFWGIVCGKLTGVSAYITRMTSTNAPKHFKRHVFVNYLFLSFINYVIAQAYSHKEYLIKSERMSPGKIEVIYNGVDLNRFQNSSTGKITKRSLGIPEDASTIGIVARLAPEKGHATLLRAAAVVIGKIPDAHFVFVGDGVERGGLEKTATELAIRSNVHFLGSREDIPDVVSLFDIAVLCSNPHVETFSNSILEYMAAARPVVTTNVGSIAEQVIDGETGFLIPHGNPAELADRILKLLRTPELAKKMGKAGRDYIIEKFTVQKMVEKYENLFAGLVS